jgi:hypothetical protein
MKYNFTSIDFASWPQDPMFGMDNTDFITTTIHLEHYNPLKAVDVEITVGDMGE